MVILAAERVGEGGGVAYARETDQEGVTMRDREQRCGMCAHAHKYEYQPKPISFLAAATQDLEPVRDVKIQCRRFPPVVIQESGTWQTQTTD